jgi:hypothetical protein
LSNIEGRFEFNPSFLLDWRKVQRAYGSKADWLCILFAGLEIGVALIGAIAVWT